MRWLALAAALAGCTGVNPDFIPECARDPSLPVCAHPEQFDLSIHDLAHRAGLDFSGIDLMLRPGCGGEDQTCCPGSIDAGDPFPWCNKPYTCEVNGPMIIGCFL